MGWEALLRICVTVIAGGGIVPHQIRWTMTRPASRALTTKKWDSPSHRSSAHPQEACDQRPQAARGRRTPAPQLPPVNGSPFGEPEPPPAGLTHTDTGARQQRRSVGTNHRPRKHRGQRTRPTRELCRPRDKGPCVPNKSMAGERSWGGAFLESGFRSTKLDNVDVCETTGNLNV